MKKFLMLFVLCCIVIAGWIFYQQSTVQSIYNGLPTVPCIDTTQPIIQSFSFHLSITISGKPYAIPSTLGYDYGKCLHTIHAKDDNGTIMVVANDKNTYTLGQVFDVWRKTFTPEQIMQYQVSAIHHITVLVNGRKVEDYRNTPLQSGEDITISYE